MMRTRSRFKFFVFASMILFTIGTGNAKAAKLNIVTTVSPITNLVKNIGGDKVILHGIVPEGTNSHTFEPSPSDIKFLAAADMLIYQPKSWRMPIRKKMLLS